MLKDGKTPGLSCPLPAAADRNDGHRATKTWTRGRILQSRSRPHRSRLSYRGERRACLNWTLGMRARTIETNLNTVAPNVDLVIGEGVMGLFDGASSGGGSTADVAVTFDIPVVLVVDASGQASSAAALVHGFDTFDSHLKLAGVIFNLIGGPKHREILQSAMASRGTQVVGCIETRLPRRCRSGISVSFKRKRMAHLRHSSTMRPIRRGTCGPRGPGRSWRHSPDRPQDEPSTVAPARATNCGRAGRSFRVCLSTCFGRLAQPRCGNIVLLPVSR